MNKAVPVLTVAALALAAVLLPALPASAATTGKVTIQLVKPSGSALHLRGVVVTATSGAAVVKHSTDRFGRATFRLPNHARETFTAARTGYLSATKGVRVLAGKSLHPRMTLRKGATATGTVTKSTGGALAGSIVTLYTRAGTAVASTTTNAKGVYKFVGLKTGKYVAQFNSRNVYNTASAAMSGFTTNYWHKASSWASSSVLNLHNQGAKTKATVAKRINSVVGAGHSLSGGLSILDIGNGGLVGLVGANPAMDITGPLTGLGSGFSMKVPAGDYKLWVSNGLTGSAEIKLWYTGMALIPSFTESDAATFTFSDTADMNILMAPFGSGEPITLPPIVPPIDLPVLPTLPIVTTPVVTTPVVTTPVVTTPVVTTPVVTTPAVTTPVVTTPDVTTPVGTVPSVTVPSVTVPSVTVPSITVPSVTVPSITVPGVTLPPVVIPPIVVP